MINTNNKALVKIIQAYDGEKSLENWALTPGTPANGTYARLISHALSIGLDISLVPQGVGVLQVTLILKP
jgi:hypothetical protein